MSKLLKQYMNDELRSTLDGVDGLVILRLNQLTAVQNNEMRLALQEKDIRVRVVKNNLARLIFGEKGWSADSGKLLDGPSAIAFGSDSIVDLAKEIVDWTKKLKVIEIKGGAADGQALSPDQVRALSELPSREELIGRVASLAIAPAARLVSLMNAPGSRIVGQLETIADKESGE